MHESAHSRTHAHTKTQLPLHMVSNLSVSEPQLLCFQQDIQTLGQWLQTDKQTVIQTDRQTVIQTDGQTDRWMDTPPTGLNMYPTNIQS